MNEQSKIKTVTSKVLGGVKKHKKKVGIATAILLGLGLAHCVHKSRQEYDLDDIDDEYFIDDMDDVVDVDSEQEDE